MNFMKDKLFFDTNVLVYAHLISDIKKQVIAKELILNSIGKIGLISTQVINEFYSALQKNKIEHIVINPFK